MRFGKIAVFVGLAGWLSLSPASFAAPDSDAIPPATVVPSPAASPEPKPAPVTTPDFNTYLPEPEPFVDTTRWPMWAEDAWNGTADVLHDHLRISIRYHQVNLKDDRRDVDNSFLGSITELNTQSDYELITWLTFDWLFNPYIGGRLAWEQVRAQTFTDQGTSGLNHSDGNVDLFGPSLMLLLRYPNKTRLIPTAGVGYTWLTSTFEHNPVWHNGFGGETRQQDYDAWVADGSPAWPNNGYQRTITLDDTTAVILYGELAFQITPHLDIHGFIQSMDVEGVDLTYELSHYGYLDRPGEPAVFPMSNTSYGAGLRWAF